MTVGFADPEHPSAAMPARGGLAGWQVRKLNTLVRGDLRLLTAAALAGEVRLSPFHFNRAFSSTMGLTPGRWLTRARVERARTLLNDPAMSVSQVARQVGYRGAPQLTRAFRSHFDQSPSEYRQAQRQAPHRPATRPGGPSSQSAP